MWLTRADAQAIGQVINGRYAVTLGQAMKLAAIQLALEIGPSINTSRDLDLKRVQMCLKEGLTTYLPPDMLGTLKSKKKKEIRKMIEKEFISEIQDMPNCSAEKLEAAYLDVVREWPLYGSAVFFVEVSFTL